MALVLTVESSDCPAERLQRRIRIEMNGHLDIGRGSDLDWTLPDPSRIISTKHCEIRFRGGRYWLYDVSRNGTFLNEEVQRLQRPHPLKDGDRFAVGSYIIAVSVEAATDSGGCASIPSGAVRRLAATPQAAAANKTIERHGRSVAQGRRSTWR